ncbi:hypothetical protein N6H14_02495 [Paenibacillus sp. CC-CFT747]|nr:hypothetical protein N6H14_02495 [Paenibacillus sp. CC-CFT747]
MIYRQNRKWLAWVEAAVIYGAAAFWLITYDVPWLLWSPNPFLFVVLYFALRYGNRVGIAAAAGASALHLASFLQENGDWYGLFDRWENSKWFISYWGIALFVGHVASDLRFRYAVLADEQEETKEHLAKVEESYGDLMKVKAALENKVVGAQESLFTLYKIARALDSDNSEIIFTDAVRLFKDLIKAASIVIYRMSPSGDILRRKVYFGGEITYPATVFLDRPSVYARVCSERTIQLRMENEPADSPMLAGPLLDEEGKVIAVIGLNGLDFAAMNRHTVDLFRLILVWMGKAASKRSATSSWAMATGISPVLMS